MLVDFWLENFKVQVEARSGLLHVALQGRSTSPVDVSELIQDVKSDEPPRKRRKVQEAEDQNLDAAGNVAFDDWNADPGIGMDMDMVVGFGGNIDSLPWSSTITVFIGCRSQITTSVARCPVLDEFTPLRYYSSFI